MTGRKVILSIIAVTAGIITAVAAGCMLDVMKVQGDSMDPAVKGGSHVLINRMAYFFGNPDAGDVVACPCYVYSEDGEGSVIIRRIAAVEGDTVGIRDGNLYINGNVYTAYSEKGVYLDDMSEITIGKNRVFVISDTGQAVLDSRDPAVGQLTTAELAGRVLFK